MVQFNPIQRQPDNLDFASPSQYRFNIIKLPHLEYFATSINVPTISFTGNAEINSRYKTLAFMGDTLDFGDLEVTFLVNEDLSNYREIHDWMIGIGFPKSPTQFSSAVSENADLKPGSSPSRTDVNRVGGSSELVNPSTLVSDATLTILSNKNNPVIRVNFKALYPTSLGGLQYNAQTTDTEQLTSTVTFKYDLYEFEVL